MKTQRTWKAVFLRPDADPEAVTVDLRDLDSLRKLLGIVGSLEIVYTRAGILYVDDNGRAKGLPFNRHASSHYPGWPPNPIVGPALLVSQKDFNSAEKHWSD